MVLINVLHLLINIHEWAKVPQKHNKISLLNISNLTQSQGHSNIGIKSYSCHFGIEMRLYQNCGIGIRIGLYGIRIAIG